MMGPIAQGTSNSLLVAIVFTAVSLPVGLLLGYLWGYRYKFRYDRVAKELSNLKGENFRGELSRVGIPQGSASRPVPLPSGADKLARAEQVERELRAELAERTAQRDQLAAELAALREQLDQWPQPRDDASRDDEPDRTLDQGANGDAHGEERESGIARDSISSPTGTEVWQLAQLHKEQIAMQLRLDDYLEQIHQLTQQRDQWQQQANSGHQEFQQLRQLLAEQEAIIASVERQRDSLATRIGELEQR
jgi:hypothetical protein